MPTLGAREWSEAVGSRARQRQQRYRHDPFPSANHLQSFEHSVDTQALGDNLPHVALIVLIWRFAQHKKRKWRKAGVKVWRVRFKGP